MEESLKVHCKVAASTSNLFQFKDSKLYVSVIAPPSGLWAYNADKGSLAQLRTDMQSLVCFWHEEANWTHNAGKALTTFHLRFLFMFQSDRDLHHTFSCYHHKAEQAVYGRQTSYHAGGCDPHDSKAIFFQVGPIGAGNTDKATPGSDTWRFPGEKKRRKKKKKEK